jgi:hypothetical protein
MRIPILLAAALTLAACATRQERVNTLEPQTAGSVRLYANSLPECPYHELGYVSGRRVSDIKNAAFSMRANAVLLEPVEGGRSDGPLGGTAIRFDSATCRG